MRKIPVTEHMLIVVFIFPFQKPRHVTQARCCCRSPWELCGVLDLDAVEKLFLEHVNSAIEVERLIESAHE
jgi:hypothetical protein